MSKLSRLPDFIIIGAMKSATSTLHNQLEAQSGVFMSTPKEPNFFSDDAIYRQGLDWYSGLFVMLSLRISVVSRVPTTLSCLIILILFSVKGGYSSAKVIYVMRHPVDRLISHYMHQWSEGVISCDIIRR